jgi:hypothetical protein
MSSPRQKPEDSADGCRAFATSDRDKAAATPSGQMRICLERSADAWTARASLLERLRASFDARAAVNRGAKKATSFEGLNNG